MQAEKKASTKTHSEYTVEVTKKDGTRVTRKVLIVEDYSTEADIPQIVATAMPGSKVQSWMLLNTKQVRSFR